MQSATVKCEDEDDHCANQESSGSATRLNWHRTEVDVESEARCLVVPGLEVVCSAKHAADEVELLVHA